jgi:hypothetical protein
MGYMRHHAIIVSGTDCQDTTVEQARTVAVEIWGDRASRQITPILDARINGYKSFAILTDGSKEGWDDSNEADVMRDAFVAWMESKRYGDRSSPLAWVEVQYDDDEGVTKVTRHSDEYRGQE